MEQNNPLILMELKKSTFTKSEIKIYETIMNDPELVSRESIVNLAQYCKVSQPSITRFCHKLGYSAYSQFRLYMYRYARAKTLEDTKDDIGSIGILKSYQKLIEVLLMAINDQQILEVARAIKHAKHIFVTGIQQSYLPAQLLEINLSKLGFYSRTVEYSILGDMVNYAKEEDLIVMFSVRANSEIYQKIVSNYQSDAPKPKFMLITMNEKTHLKGMVDYFLCLPPAVSKDYTFRLESQVLFFIIVDVITSYLASQV